MPSTPQQHVDDQFAHDLPCAICGQRSLKVVHVEGMPDYVQCSSCESAFIKEEGGERVFYGQINPDYPETARFALRQWAWFEAIETRAEAERPAAEPASPLPAEPEPDDLEALDRLRDLSAGAVKLDSEPVEEAPSAQVPLESRPIARPETDAVQPQEKAPEIELGARLAVAAPPEQAPPGETSDEGTAEGPPEPEPEPEPYAPPEGDPPPGQRHRVVLRGESVAFPDSACAHCMGTPVKGRLAVIGALPNGQELGNRKQQTFSVPLCDSCRRRAAQLSDEARAARLQAHLVSAITAMVLVIGSLIFGLVNPQALGLADLLIVLILVIIGYTIPAMILLSRLTRYDPPPDAAYVRTTLLVPRETQGLETAFEWRNDEYAQLFAEANEGHMLGRVTSVKDRIAPP